MLLASVPWIASFILPMQLTLFDEPKPKVEDLLSRREDQWFDRKSTRIDARALADAMVGFANADGGRIVVGIRNGEVEGVLADPRHLNALRQAAIDFTLPPVRHSVLSLDCVNSAGAPDQLLIIDIEASEHKHRNVRQECFLRVGDENRRLGTDEERELIFDKGEAIFDSTLAGGIMLDDLDLGAIQKYAERMGASDTRGLMRSRGIVVEVESRARSVTQAGWLLFGRVTPVWSYIRYLRYSGVNAETGVRSNLVDDITLEGTIPTLIEKAQALLRDKMATVIRLSGSGRFERMPVLPEFAWLEAVVNAVTHRSYSMQGDGVRITEFDDRLEVESPGRLPGLVRVRNIRNSRFSRNPHIARILAEMTVSTP